MNMARNIIYTRQVNKKALQFYPQGLVLRIGVNSAFESGFQRRLTESITALYQPQNPFQGHLLLLVTLLTRSVDTLCLCFEVTSVRKDGLSVPNSQ